MADLIKKLQSKKGVENKNTSSANNTNSVVKDNPEASGTDKNYGVISSAKSTTKTDETKNTSSANKNEIKNNNSLNQNKANTSFDVSDTGTNVTISSKNTNKKKDKDEKDEERGTLKTSSVSSVATKISNPVVDKAVDTLTGGSTAVNNALDTLAPSSVSGTSVTVYDADGKAKSAHIVNGKTYLDDGSDLKDGDVIKTSGGTYVYDAALGKGMQVGDSTENVDENKYYSAYVPGQGLVTITGKQIADVESKGGYVYKGLGGVEVGTDANGLTSITNNNEALAAAGGNKSGTYNGYTPKWDASNENAGTVQNHDVKNTLANSAGATVSSDGTIDLSSMTSQQAISALANLVQSNVIDLDKFLTWAEAYGMAEQILGGSYDAETASALNDLQKSALKSGMYGQIPYEQIKANTAAEMELKKVQAIGEYAKQLRESDAETAISRFNALVDQQQITNDDLTNLLEMMIAYEQDEKDRQQKQSQWEAEQQLSQDKFNYEKQQDELNQKNSTSKTYTGTQKTSSETESLTGIQETMMDNFINSVFGSYADADDFAVQSALGQNNMYKNLGYSSVSEAMQAYYQLKALNSLYGNGEQNVQQIADNDFNTFLSNLKKMISIGDPNIESYTNEYMDKYQFSQSQIEQLKDMLRQNGYDI